MTESVTALCPPIVLGVEEERLRRKQRASAAFRLFAQMGFDHGVTGHVTVRDPQFPELFWVNPFGVHFGLIKPNQLLLVDHKGTIVQGSGEVNVPAYVIHAAIHEARPEVVAAVHTHSTYGKVWSTTGRMLDPITQDACAFFRNHSVFQRYTGIIDSVSEAQLLSESLGENKAAILSNHGLITVGETVDSAAWWFIAMERCCQVQVLSESCGTPLRIPDAEALKARSVVGTEAAGWRNFQPIFNFISRQAPDLFD